MYNISINLRNKNWYEDDYGNYAIGHAFINDRLITGEKLIQHIIQGWNENKLEEYFRELNGFFSLIIKRKHSIIASADRLRSFPLYYSLQKGHFYLSDDSDWIQKYAKENKLDDVSKTEFLLSGYVTGSCTLFPYIRQIQAGECIILNNLKQNPVLNTKRWFCFLHNDLEEWNVDELNNELDHVINNIHKRLTLFAQNRTIVIPLSGGFDSRLILTALKRMNIEKVITFSYGRKDNKESLISKNIADTLGFPWYFIEYNNKLWKDTIKSGKLIDFMQYSSGNVSLPHIQDWPSIIYLLEKKIINIDSIIVPGHAGDFISGGHIPHTMFLEKDPNIHRLLGYLIKQNYCLRKWEAFSTEMQERIKNKILKIITGYGNIKTINDLANYFELWDWQERQAKFIVNSVRVYDYFNIKWWLPLWDKEFIDFWLKVPLKLRKGSEFYDNYVITLYSTISGINTNNARRTERTEPVYKGILRKTYNYLPEFINNYRIKRFYLSRIKNHPLNFYSIFDKNELSNYIQNDIYLFNGIFADQYIKHIEKIS